MDFFKKIAQELSDDKFAKMLEIKSQLIGEEFEGKGFIKWLQEKIDRKSKAKMVLVRAYKGHPVYDAMVLDFIELESILSKYIESKDSSIELEIVSKVKSIDEKMDAIIDGKDLLEQALQNENIYGSKAGEFRADSLATRMTNQMKEFKSFFTFKILNPILECFNQEASDFKHDQMYENEKYISEPVIIFMINQYPNVLGLADNKTDVFAQLELVKQDYPALISKISNFLNRLQRSGLGSENGPDDEEIEELEKIREEIYSELKSVSRIASNSAPDNLKLKPSRELAPGRNLLLQRQDYINKLDSEQSLINESNQDKIKEINLKIEEVNKEMNKTIGKLKKALQSASVLGGEDAKKAKQKLNKKIEERDAMIAALNKEKESVLLSTKQASKIIKELGLR